MSKCTLVLMIITIAAICSAGSVHAQIAPVQLRCEYAVDTPAVDTPHPRLSWQLESPDKEQIQTAYQIRVATSEAISKEGRGDLWDSGKVDSAEQNQIEYAGSPLRSFQECFWTVRVWDKTGSPSEWSSPAKWAMGLLNQEDWKGVWISSPDATTEASGPLPLYRKEFAVSAPVRRAVLYVCGLGFHEISLNGKKVGDGEYEPGWTNYRKTCLYSTHDVTDQIKQKENALGIMLGNGMYNVPGGRYVKFKGTFGPPKFILQMRIEYQDGTVQEIVSDDSWKTEPGPVVFSCIYGGEDYDAQKESPGWDSTGFDASTWKNAVTVDGPGGTLRAACIQSIKVMQTFSTVEVTPVEDGIYICDLGQNFSGRPCLRVRGPRGATVKLVPGESLHENGRISQRSSGGPMWFSYTLKGEGEEVWHPLFSYYGFRYVQVEGAQPAGAADNVKDLPEIVELTGQFTHLAADRVGSFECSNPLVNRIHNLILAAIRSNLQSVLTDCPHREKLGWLEVSHLLSDGIMYNFDAARFYAKIEQDCADSQIENGLIPDISPEFTVFDGGFRDSPEWGSAGVINPWNAYLAYGDRRTLETHYGVMRRYVDYLGSKTKDHIVSHGLGDWCDVGPGGPGESKLTSKEVTATAVYYQDLCILQQVASLLGKVDEASAIAARAAEVRAAFNKALYHPDTKQYDRNSQTANAMPLILGIVDQTEREAVAKNLISVIQAANYHVTAGDVGFSYLVRALTDSEQGDVLYQMVCQTDGPGYAFQLEKGATSLAEAWDANPAMSQNHCMLGHVEGWFYRGLAGIRLNPEEPGFKHFVLRPQFPEGLEWVKAHYDSIRGRIASEWQVDKDSGTWTVSIPPNTTATIFVPATAVDAVTESGRPLSESRGLSAVRSETAAIAMEAASGKYVFTWSR